MTALARRVSPTRSYPRIRWREQQPTLEMYKTLFFSALLAMDIAEFVLERGTGRRIWFWCNWWNGPFLQPQHVSVLHTHGKYLRVDARIPWLLTVVSLHQW